MIKLAVPGQIDIPIDNVYVLGCIEGFILVDSLPWVQLDGHQFDFVLLIDRQEEDPTQSNLLTRALMDETDELIFAEIDDSLRNLLSQVDKGYLPVRRQHRLVCKHRVVNNPTLIQRRLRVPTLFTFGLQVCEVPVESELTVVRLLEYYATYHFEVFCD